MGLVPLLAWVALILGVLAITFGVAGVRRAREAAGAGRGMAIGGLITGAIALVLAIVGFTILADVVEDLENL